MSKIRPRMRRPSPGAAGWINGVWNTLLGSLLQKTCKRGRDADNDLNPAKRAAWRWRDILDILLVAVIIYRVLTLFRGTRAVQITIGLAVLAAAAVAAGTLELTSLGWLLDHFWSFWAIAVIVLFQPELRRIFTHLGQGNWLRLHPRVRTRHLEAVLNAAEILAAKRASGPRKKRRTKKKASSK